MIYELIYFSMTTVIIFFARSIMMMVIGDDDDMMMGLSFFFFQSKVFTSKSKIKIHSNASHPPPLLPSPFPLPSPQPALPYLFPSFLPSSSHLLRIIIPHRNQPRTIRHYPPAHARQHSSSPLDKQKEKESEKKKKRNIPGYVAGTLERFCMPITRFTGIEPKKMTGPAAPRTMDQNRAGLVWEA